MAERIRAAVVQYQVGHSGTADAFVARIAAKVRQARDKGAEIVVFPEYLCVDLLPALGAAGSGNRADPSRLFMDLDACYAHFVGAMRTLARTEAVWLIAGTFAHRVQPDGFCNAAQIFGPAGEHVEQPKLHVAYELIHNRHLIRPGQHLRLFDVCGARAAVLVCYDAQFPESARAAVDLGDLDLVIVPGCALEPWGIWRLRTAAAARAMESFAYALNAQLTGRIDLPDVHYQFWARSSVHAPISKPFPVDGILVDSVQDEDDVLVTTLDIGALRAARPHGFPSLRDRKIPVPARYEPPP